mgnify:CR=1 FL=1
MYLITLQIIIVLIIAGRGKKWLFKKVCFFKQQKTYTNLVYKSY